MTNVEILCLVWAIAGIVGIAWHVFFRKKEKTQEAVFLKEAQQRNALSLAAEKRRLDGIVCPVCGSQGFSSQEVIQKYSSHYNLATKQTYSRLTNKEAKRILMGGTSVQSYFRSEWSNISQGYESVEYLPTMQYDYCNKCSHEINHRDGEPTIRLGASFGV